MELRHLRYFVAVADSLSFTGAAERLGVSQPPLSQQIRDLEAELGTPLLWRTSRSVALTPAGTAFLARARHILAEVEEACAEARAIGAGRSGTLDVGLTGSILAGPLGRLIRLFGERYPAVLVRLHEMPPGEQPAALHAHRTDLCFLRRPPEDPSLRVVRAWPEAVGVALPAGHPLAERAAIALGDLSDEPFVSLRLRDSRFATYLQEACLSAGFVPRIVQQVVESASLVNLVAAGLGVALVPASAGALPRPDIAYRPLAGPAPVADVCALYRVPAGAVTENFLNLMRDALGRADPDRAGS
ncbi:LysR family transcriptional regulator [Methylobacterium sp. SyP6R]|uniref:LysR family transcriptional regulator n=1 Tax=Methylobacterium sp. SyP6R TaxID=2718876 RepID=UPI001F2FFFA1|nr:LysR family transcriptional regulator [Methylobacterium sp. SyP6R]MCF4124270.1 LysR family transcriptional regulator [Methylobacterium sp. SyP6R]